MNLYMKTIAFVQISQPNILHINFYVQIILRNILFHGDKELIKLNLKKGKKLRTHFKTYLKFIQQFYL